MLNKPSIHTCLSPSLLHLYQVNTSIILIIDILRATSTIATALYNGAESVIPVDSVEECIKLGKIQGTVTAGERDGQIAEGLSFGNTPFQYTKEFIQGKTLVLTTTNGTKLLHMALTMGAKNIITGSFPNITSVCSYLIAQKTNVVLACAAWKDRVNIEDTLFAGAVVNRIKSNFTINCDSSQIAETIYKQAMPDLFEFMKTKNASHYQRLMNFGLESDIKFCLTEDVSDILPIYNEGRLIAHY